MRMKNDDMVVNEGGETLNNSKSSEKKNVGGDEKYAKIVSPQNADSAMKMKSLQIKIDPPFPQRLQKKEEDSKFQNFL